MAKYIGSLLVMIGLIFGGWFIGDGFKESRQPVRTVTVKGVAEKDVKADLALWSIQFVQAGNDLSSLQANIQRDDQTVSEFLSQQHISTQEISTKTLKIIDKQASQYTDNNNTAPRYILTRTVLLRSADVNKIAQAYEASGNLINQGIVLGTNDYGGNDSPIYLFNGLNDIKSPMIKEATDNAREAAQEFAKNTDTSLSKIIKADQGVFQILPQDKAPMLMEQNQINKTVRVVSTLTFQIH